MRPNLIARWVRDVRSDGCDLRLDDVDDVEDQIDQTWRDGTLTLSSLIQQRFRLVGEARHVAQV